jgi:hypothetical protein
MCHGSNAPGNDAEDLAACASLAGVKSAGWWKRKRARYSRADDVCGRHLELHVGLLGGETGGLGAGRDHTGIRGRRPAKQLVERAGETLVEQRSLHERPRMRRRRLLQQLVEVAKSEPLVTDEVGMQAPPVADRTGEERAVDPAGARTAEEIEHEAAPERDAERVVDGPAGERCGDGRRPRRNAGEELLQAPGDRAWWRR